MYLTLYIDRNTLINTKYYQTRYSASCHLRQSFLYVMSRYNFTDICLTYLMGLYLTLPGDIHRSRLAGSPVSNTTGEFFYKHVFIYYNPNVYAISIFPNTGKVENIQINNIFFKQSFFNNT